MNHYYSMDKKKFLSLEEKTKHDMILKDNFDVYVAMVIIDQGPNAKEPGGTMTCPGSFFVRRSYEKGIRDMRVNLREKYGDEFIDQGAGIKRWQYIKIDPFSDTEGREFIQRYGVISVIEGPVADANKESRI